MIRADAFGVRKPAKLSQSAIGAVSGRGDHSFRLSILDQWLLATKLAIKKSPVFPPGFRLHSFGGVRGKPLGFLCIHFDSSFVRAA